MPQQTKIFRVFVSSTFTDMKEEHRILQKDLFPRLEKFCEANGAKFQADEKVIAATIVGDEI